LVDKILPETHARYANFCFGHYSNISCIRSISYDFIMSIEHIQYITNHPSRDSSGSTWDQTKRKRQKQWQYVQLVRVLCRKRHVFAILAVYLLVLITIHAHWHRVSRLETCDRDGKNAYRSWQQQVVTTIKKKH